MPAAPPPTAPALRTADPHHRARVGLVIAGGFVCQLALGYGYSHGHVLNDITAELGWSRAEFSSVRVPQLIMMSLASPLVGWGLGRIGARPILVGSVLCLFASSLILSRMSELWQFGASAAFHGVVAVGLGDVVVGAIVARWVARSRGLALGVVFAGSNVGGWLLAQAIPRLAAEYGWRVALLSVGTAGAALMLPFALWVLRMPHVGEGVLDATDESPASDAGADDASADDLDLAGALRTRSFWILAYALGAFFFVFVGVLDHLVAFLRDSGLPRTDASQALGRAVGVGLIAKPLFGAFADRLDRRFSLWFQYGLLAVGAAGLLALPSPWWTTPVLVAFGFATAARDVSYPLIIEHCFGPRNLAEIYGALMFLLWAGAVGSLVAGRIHDVDGSYQMVWLVFAALAGTSFLATLFVRDERALPRSGAPRRDRALRG